MPDIRVEFSGGLETLFGGDRSLAVAVADGASLGDLVRVLADRVAADRRDLFVLSDGSVRPGILVLINDADWELEGEHAYVLQPSDTILFASTLHGG
ncbi:ubiquitin-related modifier 1 [Dipodascopsis tothii]|uniref:ubiquitin-related modifier 1 n=1 Tax=Dipodascopsis tothii TaxID=44089 RepID=UPI0034CD1797